MTRHWLPDAQSKAPARGPEQEAAAGGGRFELAFRRHGARTTICRQFVSYPFHMTRPFQLDAAIPALATVYQQSSSGGLYRGERLTSRYELAGQAAAHVTTQAATVVHDCQGLSARHLTTIDVGEGAFLALTPDPLVLFPGADCETRLTARIAPGAVLLLVDGFAMHDPKGRSRPFARLRGDVVICDGAGRLLLRDCFAVEGAALVGTASPLGSWRAATTMLVVGDADRLPTRAAIEEATEASSADGAVIGLSPLPSGAGWCLRCLAADAVSMRRAVEAVFAATIRSAFGHPPTPRRK